MAPSERPPITNLGRVSSLPERLGVDICWQSPNGMCGIQRKAVPDLIASVRDGRLGKELQQMQAAKLTHAFVVIEGQMNFASDGKLMSQHTQWSKRQQTGVELSIQRQGAMVLHTLTALDTCAMAEHLYEWAQKERERSSLLYRSNAKANGWGRLSDRDYAIHILSGIEGIQKLAANVYDAYGCFPCRHILTEDSLLAIDKIGPTRMRAIIRAFEAPADEATEGMNG